MFLFLGLARSCSTTEMRGMRESGSERRSGRVFIGMQGAPGAALGLAGLAAAIRGITWAAAVREKSSRALVRSSKEELVALWHL